MDGQSIVSFLAVPLIFGSLAWLVLQVVLTAILKQRL